MVDAWKIHQTRRVPDEVINFIHSKGFMALLIPEEDGGLGFSWLGISTVLHMLGQSSAHVGTYVTIANSLSASELIKHYGTADQKKLLSKLASGELVPCFALTEPKNGSDAAGIEAEGILFRDTNGQLNVRLNFEKRYMTLGPVANLTTLSFHLFDPEHLLGQVDQKGEPLADIGISCGLLWKGTPGFTQGNHHIPIGDGFFNGPLFGKNVIMPVDDIIGGVDGAGHGWKMLMQQLAGGRAISLPAGALAGMKLAATATSAYSMVRRQFGMPIGKMEGIIEKVAHINAMTYMMEAARVGVCSLIDSGVAPPVIAGALKLFSTELGAETVIAGMDVFGGAAVMQGPRNILGRLYGSLPVGKTVEGASIMSRTLLTTGQGAMRCHPFALDVLTALEEDESADFCTRFASWLGHASVGSGRCLARDLTCGFAASKPHAVAPETADYYKRLDWATARFGMLIDRTLLTIGPKLKVKGMLSGRLTDAFGWILWAKFALLRFEREGRRPEDLPLVSYVIEHNLQQVQRAFEGIYANFDVPVVGFLMRKIGSPLLRLNTLSAGPSDHLKKRAAATMQTYGDQFLRLSDGVFMPDEDTLGLGVLLKAFRLETKARGAAAKLSKAQKANILPRTDIRPKLIRAALDKGVVTAQEADLLMEAYQAMEAAIEVDVFEPGEYERS
jgi:acyl-CoA dehydrogenase